MAVWEGRGTADLQQISRSSFLVQIGSYVVVAAAFLAGILAVVNASWLATASILILLALVFMLAAQVLAGVQYVRHSGPPGALPAHMHKAISRQESRRS